MIEEDYQAIDFRILSDEDLSKYHPPSRFRSQYQRWLREINRRKNGSEPGIDKSTVDYSQLNPCMMSLEDLKRYLPSRHDNDALYKRFYREIKKREETKIVVDPQPTIDWKSVDFSHLTDEELVKFKPPRHENTAYMAYYREIKKRHL